MAKYVTFSFDDGIEQDVKFVEKLNKYGFKATFNINTGIQTRANTWLNNGVEIHRMNIKGLKELYSGHEVAVHTLTHPFLEKQDEETIYNEIYYDKKNIEEWFGEEVVGMAYPYGTYDERVIKIAKEIGIKYARTAGTSMKFTVPDDGSKNVLYIWGHTYEFDVLDKWNLLDDILERLKRVKAEFVTNREAFGL